MLMPPQQAGQHRRPCAWVRTSLSTYMYILFFLTCSSLRSPPSSSPPSPASHHYCCNNSKSPIGSLCFLPITVYPRGHTQYTSNRWTEKVRLIHFWLASLLPPLWSLPSKCSLNPIAGFQSKVACRSQPVEHDDEGGNSARGRKSRGQTGSSKRAIYTQVT